MKKSVLECDLCKRQFPDTDVSEANLIQDTGVHVCPECKYIYLKMYATVERALRARFNQIHDVMHILVSYIEVIDWTSPDTIKHFGVIARDIQKFKEKLLSEKTEDGDVKTE